MQRKYAEQFDAGKYVYPLGTRPDEHARHQFFLDVANYVYGMYCSGRGVVAANGATRFTDAGGLRTIPELRAYARGMQPTGKYRKLIDFKVKNGSLTNPITGAPYENKSGSVMNISWDTSMFFPKFRRVAISKLLDARLEPEVVATDDLSSYRRRLQYFAARIEADPRTKAMVKQAGLATENPSVADFSVEDIDILHSLGGFGLAVEAMLRDNCEASLSDSGFDGIREQLLEDLFDVNMMSVDVNVRKGGVRVKYVDPANLIVPVSQHKDYRDAAFCGYWEEMTLSEVAASGGPSIGSPDFQEVVSQYRDWASNARIYKAGAVSNGGQRLDFMASSAVRHLPNMSTVVVTLYVRACDIYRFVDGYHKRGTKLFTPVSPDSKLSGRHMSEGNFMSDVPIDTIYRMKWIPGTSVMWDCGFDKGVVRVSDGEYQTGALPMVVWGGDSPSITACCISAIDDAQLAIYKRRMLINNLPPGPRLAVDMALVQESISIAGEQYTMKDILGTFASKGVLLYSSTPEWSAMGQDAANRNPLLPVPLSIAEDLQLFRSEVEDALGMIRQFTGMNEVVDGTANPSDMLIGVMRGMEAASNNALKPLFYAQKSMYERMVTVLAKKWQSMVLYGGAPIKSLPIGVGNADLFSLLNDMVLLDFRVVGKLVPNEEDIATMTQLLVGKSQMGEIDEATLFAVLNLLRQRDVAKAQFLLSKAVAATKREAARQQQEAILAQGQMNKEAAVATEEAKRQTVMAKYEGEMMLLERRYELESQLGSKRHQESMEADTVNNLQLAATADVD